MMLVCIIVCFWNCSLHTVHQPLSRATDPTSVSAGMEGRTEYNEWHHCFVQRLHVQETDHYLVWCLIWYQCLVCAGDWSMITSFCNCIVHRGFSQLPLLEGRIKQLIGSSVPQLVTFPNKKWHFKGYLLYLISGISIIHVCYTVLLSWSFDSKGAIREG